MEDVAISTLSTILVVQPGMSMKLSTLALPSVSKWAQEFKPTLGVIKDFLLSYPNIFHVEDKLGAGNDVITLVSPTSPNQNIGVTDPFALPRITDDLWRPFDKFDSFFHDPSRLDKINFAQVNHWQRYFHPALPNSPLYNMAVAQAKQIYDQAFRKCARLSIGISYVVLRRLSATDVRAEFEKHAMIVGDNQVRLFLYKDETDRGQMYSETYATVWGPGFRGHRPLNALVNVVEALNHGLLRFQGKTLSLYCVGYGPVWLSVSRGIHEILRSQTTIVAPPSPGPVISHSPATVVPQDEIVSALPFAPLTPTEIVYDGLHRPVVYSDSPHMQRARAFLNEKEGLLRQRCAEQRILPKAQQRQYAERSGVEWMSGPEFTLGKGFEATICMGLLRDMGELKPDGKIPAEPERTLVSVKVCNTGDPFNSQELDHYISMKKVPGIAQYHKGFTVESEAMEFTFIVQELGLCSLRTFLTGGGRMNLPPYELSGEEKFTMTKALCMAVRELHVLTPSITHRDIRPENVLVMPNGTITLTDFGLARRTPHRYRGASGYVTHNVLTTMQPYEVQERFLADPGGMQQFMVDPSADVFMLGLVIAYVHMGFDPYTEDRQIMNRAAPNLGTTLQHEQPWLYHLLTRMLHHNAEKRPSMEHVLQHPYFCSWSENFDVSLVSRVENVIIADYHPVDNKQFRTLETLLRPIEDQMVAAEKKWYQALPRSLFEGKAKLPNVENGESALRFQPNGDTPSRPYPLPKVAQFIKWLRNVRTHFPGSPTQQDALRRTRALVTGVDGDYYATVGDFFMFHPAVEWFLPMVWEHSYDLLQACYREQRAFQKHYEEVLLRLEQEKQALDDHRDALEAFLA